MCPSCKKVSLTRTQHFNGGSTYLICATIAAFTWYRLIIIVKYTGYSGAFHYVWTTVKMSTIIAVTVANVLVFIPMSHAVEIIHKKKENRNILYFKYIILDLNFNIFYKK